MDQEPVPPPTSRRWRRTVQDHRKSIFDKTGVRSRGELVGQVFLQHYVPRWEHLPGAPTGWMAQATPE